MSGNARDDSVGARSFCKLLREKNLHVHTTRLTVSRQIMSRTVQIVIELKNELLYVSLVSCMCCFDCLVSMLFYVCLCSLVCPCRILPVTSCFVLCHFRTLSLSNFLTLSLVAFLALTHSYALALALRDSLLQNPDGRFQILVSRHSRF